MEKVPKNTQIVCPTEKIRSVGTRIVQIGPTDTTNRSGHDSSKSSSGKMLYSKCDVVKFDNIVIDKSSATNDKILVENVQNIHSNSKYLRNDTSFSENKVSEIAQQRHLHVCNSNYVEDEILKGKLSRKLKPVKPKFKSETPEKNEILRMFEKIKGKSEHSKVQKTETFDACLNKNLQNMPDRRSDEPDIKSKFLQDHCKTGITFENSPKLKPKIRSKFQEIRSFFEANNENPNTFLAHADSNSAPFSNLNTISGNISGDNPIIINTKSADRSGHITPTFSPNSRSLRKQKVNRSSSVVSSPNPKNSNSPQSDFKKRKPSQKRKLKVILKRNDSSSSQQPITRYFGKETN